jgi:beta-galactosidase
VKKENIFYYGTQYFRPPNPPRDQHRYHLSRIKDELGFNIVKVFWQWNSCESVKDQWDFSEYTEILDLCDEIGLNVLVQTSLEDAPYWLEREHPECRYVNAKGHAEELSGNDNHPSGGHPGLCLDSAAVMERGGRFLRAVAQEARAHPSLIGYDCWNEPHIEPNWNTLYWADLGDTLFCYCNASTTRFVDWLKRKYGSVGELNRAWKRYFGAWEEVNPPRRHGTFADWLDWLRFWFDNLRQQMGWRYGILKEADPDHFVMSHSGGIPPILARIQAGMNNFALAGEVDLWGTSVAPLAQNWTTGETAAAYDLTRSAAKGKEYWISELQAGYCQDFGLHKCPRPEPRHIRSWNWLAAVYGAKGILYWCYLEESTGNEAQGFGLVRYNGKTTDRAREAARAAALLRKYEHIIIGHSPVSDVALLYDPVSSAILFAQEGSDAWISNSHVAWYRAVWDADLYGRWVTFDDLEAIHEKVLIVPMHYIVTEKAAAALRRFVAEGGTLIAENSFGKLTPHGILQPQVPPYGLAEVFGLEEGENHYTWPGHQSASNQPFNGPYGSEINRAPVITVSRPATARFRPHGFITPLELTTAVKLGGWKDHALVACNRFGKGEAWYFGTFVGLAMFNGEKEAGRLIRSILRARIRPSLQGRRLRPRLIDAGAEGLLCVFNDDRHAAGADVVRLPAHFSHAVDVTDGRTLSLRGNRISVQVPPEDVRVFHLSAGGVP